MSGMNSQLTCCPARGGVRIILLMSVFLSLLFFPVYAVADQSDTSGPRGLGELEPHYRASVLRGWRSFQSSFAEDGVACVHCHLQHETLRHWPGAYPKVTIFDGAEYRVRSLTQVIAEALERHTDLAPEARLVLQGDLLAYISWWGEDQRVIPGVSRTIPPAGIDLVTMKRAAERGAQLLRQQPFKVCGQCHNITGNDLNGKLRPMVNAPLTFPRYVSPPGFLMPLESFLAWHLATHGLEGYTPDSSEIISITTYLAELARGQRMRPGTPLGPTE